MSSPGDTEEVKRKTGSLGEIYNANARSLFVNGNLKSYCINFSIAISHERLDLM